MPRMDPLVCTRSDSESSPLGRPALCNRLRKEIVVDPHELIRPCFVNMLLNADELFPVGTGSWTTCGQPGPLPCTCKTNLVSDPPGLLLPRC